ncbi:MAG: acetate--CoA ligase [Verrucomicrobiae bacterium]|nr:acetate--CoA ligase [Verrucomicrobiae bacterium]
MQTASSSSDITSSLRESRNFKPPAEFVKRAHLKSMAQYRKLYAESIRNPDKFWGKAAAELEWMKPWTKVCDWKEPHAKWFVGGKTNMSVNCIDRHAHGWRRNKVALIWEGEPGDEPHISRARNIPYASLLRQTCQFANVLKQFGVKKGDRVIIYMPMIPEAVFAMLACTRIGAVHSIVFGGFSSEAIKDRILDCGAEVVITADGGYRRGAVIELKKNVDAALAHCPGVRHVLVVKRTEQPVHMVPGRDHWWHEVQQNASYECPPEPMNSEDPLFILYTSGSTGKPKGIYHTTAGFMLGCQMTTKYVFDAKEDDVYWCTADIGWVTGHSYSIYGALLNGLTTVLYEGAPNHPAPDRFWQIIDKFGVTIFYTAPTAIRAFIKWGEQHVLKHSLKTLRLLGSVGEPINPEAWIWYHKVVGKGRCPIVDTWWQTETGTIMISPLPGVTPTRPGTATLPFFGVDAAVVNKEGKEQPRNVGGLLVIRKPWPSMLRGIWGDPDRYRKQYWSEVKGCYFTGDGARRDKDGYFWIMGRIDDVVNVAGHRLGTMEVESALVGHKMVAEAAVVARPDDLKGQALVAFVTLKGGQVPSNDLKDQLRAHVGKEIGAHAKPDDVRFTDALPKTRSGKIMRRLLREVATGGEIRGDMTTLEDFSTLARLRHDEE